MSSLPPFRASAWLRDRHAMTVWANAPRLRPRPPVRRARWELGDGDFVDVDRLELADRDAPLVIVCHGLEGSSRAGYVRGLVAALAARGVASLALNFRSCSGEPNRLARSYHAGELGDLADVVARVREERPSRRLGVAGFSLGGSVVAGYLATHGDRAGVDAAVAISVPFDLARCADAIDGPGPMAWVYRERFLRALRPKAIAKARRFPSLLDAAAIARVRRLRAFDDLVTAPLHGFRDAADYYAQGSTGPRLGAVRVPALLISALDDPFIPGDTVPVATIRANPALELALSTEGGHVGFLAGPPWAPVRWAEERAAEFLAERLRR